MVGRLIDETTSLIATPGEERHRNRVQQRDAHAIELQPRKMSYRYADIRDNEDAQDNRVVIH